MSFGFRRRFGRVYISLVEPGSVNAAIDGNRKRVHAVWPRRFIVVNFHFRRKALPAIR